MNTYGNLSKPVMHLLLCQLEEKIANCQTSKLSPTITFPWTTSTRQIPASNKIQWNNPENEIFMWSPETTQAKRNCYFPRYCDDVECKYCWYPNSWSTEGSKLHSMPLCFNKLSIVSLTTFHSNHPKMCWLKESVMIWVWILWLKERNFPHLIAADLSHHLWTHAIENFEGSVQN